MAKSAAAPVLALLVAVPIAFLGALLVTASPAAAHELRPATLAFRELGDGKFSVAWSPPSLGTHRPALRQPPEFPAQCHLTSPGSLDCGREGLSGELRFPALAGTAHAVIVQIEWQGGARLLRTVTAGASGGMPSLVVRGVPRDAPWRARLTVAADYTALGVEHILAGVDHLLFVLGLMLVVGLRRQLVWTITAFTAAHSVTLAAAALGRVHLPQPPVEVAIALSILLVAVEAARGGDSLTRRAPWAVAFAFGLLHGFGFAGALADVGLPPHQAPLALVSFNVGVELGQLATIAIAALLSAAAQRLLGPTPKARLAIIYVMGTAAAYWSIERTVALFS